MVDDEGFSKTGRSVLERDLLLAGGALDRSQVILLVDRDLGGAVVADEGQFLEPPAQFLELVGGQVALFDEHVRDRDWSFFGGSVFCHRDTFLEVGSPEESTLQHAIHEASTYFGFARLRHRLTSNSRRLTE